MTLRPLSFPTARLDATLLARYAWLAAPAVIVVIAVFLRFYRLAEWPPIHVDEAIGGNDALDLFDRHLDLLEPSYTHYLRASMLPLAAAFAVFGISLETLRALNALYGVGAVIAIVWAGHALFGRTAGLIAGGVMATSHVMIAMRTVGTGNSPAIFLAALCVATFAQAWKSGGRWWLVWGAVTGLGAYAYEGFRIVPVAIVLALLLSPRALWRERKGVAMAFVAFAIVAGPVLVSFASFPDTYLSEPRRQTVLGSPDGFLDAYDTNSVLVVIQKQFDLSLDYFSKGNNRDTQYMFRGPGFDKLTLALFVAGVIVGLVRFDHLGYRIALLWFWLGLLLGSAMTESPPLVPRLAVLLPAAALLIGGVVGEAVENIPVRRRDVAGVGVALFLTALMVVPNYRNYFERYTESDVYWPWVEPTRSIGAYVGRLDSGTQVFLFDTAGVWSHHPTVRFLMRSGSGASITDIGVWRESFFDPVLVANEISRGRDARFIATQEALPIIKSLAMVCPGSTIDSHYGRLGLSGEEQLQFVVFKVGQSRCDALPNEG